MCPLVEVRKLRKAFLKDSGKISHSALGFSCKFKGKDKSQIHIKSAERGMSTELMCSGLCCQSPAMGAFTNISGILQMSYSHTLLPNSSVTASYSVSELPCWAHCEWCELWDLGLHYLPGMSASQHIVEPTKKGGEGKELPYKLCPNPFSFWNSINYQRKCVSPLAFLKSKYANESPHSKLHVIISYIILYILYYIMFCTIIIIT